MSKLRKLIESIVDKKINHRRLRESDDLYDPDFDPYKPQKSTMSTVEDYIYANLDKIKTNMKDYGFELDDIKSIRNYIDLANILGTDSRNTKNLDMQEYTSLLHDLLKHTNEFEDDDF